MNEGLGTLRQRLSCDYVALHVRAVAELAREAQIAFPGLVSGLWIERRLQRDEGSDDIIYHAASIGSVRMTHTVPQDGPRFAALYGVHARDAAAWASRVAVGVDPKIRERWIVLRQTRTNADGLTLAQLNALLLHEKLQ
jgi:hypothetical protein